MIVPALVIMALAQAPAGLATLSGQVVDAKGRPAVGAEVLLSGLGAGTRGRPVLARTNTDHDGKFRVDVPAEKDPERPHFLLGLWAYTPEKGLAGQALSPSAPPAAGAVQLKLGWPAHTAVRVVGPDGKAVAGARVAPLMLRVAGGMRPRSTFPPPDSLADLLAATTDADGKGQIKGSRAEDVEAVSVEAAGFGVQLSELGPAAGGGQTIRLKPAGRLTGRVQSDNPSAARGLEVVAMTRPGAPAGPQISGEARSTTDAAGRFEIPALAAGQLALNVLPAAGRKLRPKLPSNLVIEPGKTTEVTIPMEGPPRERMVAGRALDRAGQPIAGAVVFQSGDSPARSEAETGADGRFALSGVVAAPTFLFVRKPGYRFGGLAIAPEAHNVTVIIHKEQEPPRLVRQTLPPPLPHEEDVALARRLLDPYAERALNDGGEAEKVRTLEALARIEPERVLELIQQKKVFNNAFFNAMIGLRVAVGLIEESVDEALAVLEALEEPTAKANGFIYASEKLAARDRSKALAVLDRALLNARAAREPDGIKLALLGKVAEQYLDLGETERGRAILREGQALAQQLPKGGFAGFARGAFAEDLVQIDPEAALALAKEIAGAREFDRHHGNIAHELAGRDPAQSERVLAMVKDRLQRDLYAVRVAYRMAPVDLPRARRLAASISDDCSQGFALGMMALRLNEAGKDSAREMLESAYESLERSSRSSPAQTRGLYSPTSIAGDLLPVAERVDPNLVDEYLWRALAMRQPKPWETNPGGGSAQADVLLAMMLSRYDRTIARSLVEPLARGDRAPAVYFSLRGELYVAAAVIDPKWGVALVEALPDDPDLTIRNPKNSARLAVATVLGRAGDERFRHLQQSFLHLWIPDVEDNNPYD